jgi:hypothetical protein
MGFDGHDFSRAFNAKDGTRGYSHGGQQRAPLSGVPKLFGDNGIRGQECPRHTGGSISAMLQSCSISFSLEEVPSMGRKRKKLQGTVQKVIKPAIPNQPERAQIDIEGADDLYREIRIENEVIGEDGQKAQLKPGAEVDVIVEADSSATMKKPENS